MDYPYIEVGTDGIHKVQVQMVAEGGTIGTLTETGLIEAIVTAVAAGSPGETVFARRVEVASVDITPA